MANRYLAWFMTSALLATTTASVAQSQTTSATSTAGTGTTTAAPAGTTYGNGATTAGNATGTLQGQDATFLAKAAEADRMEIAQAQAALENAQRSQTKNTARMLLDDHRRSNDQLQQLASRKGWAWPTSSGSVESDQAHMMSTSGPGFDDRFMADQIRAHRDAIALYRAEASSGSDPDLRQFAKNQLPALEHHLDMLQGANTQK